MLKDLFTFINFEKIIFLIASMYLWLMFGYLSETLSCDIKKIFKNPIFRQIIAISSIFLLFVIINKEHSSAGDIWKDTIIVYILYIFLTKNKLYYSIPIILLILIYKSLEIELKHIDNLIDEVNKNDKLNNNESNNNKLNKNKLNNNELNNNELNKLNNKKKLFIKFNKFIEITIITLIIVGFIHYFIKQKNEFGKRFDLYKFLLDVKCKK